MGEDRNWYKPECHNCPYFANDERMKLKHCVRPIGEACIFDSSILIQAVYMKEQLLTVAKQLDIMDKELAEHKMTPEDIEKRRIHKKIYRRR